MNTDNRLLLAVFLSLLLFFGYTAFFKPKSSTLLENSSEKVFSQKQELDQIAEISETTDVLKQKETEKFVVTYSETRGYIKSIELLSPKDTLNFENIGLFPNIDIVSGDLSRQYTAEDKTDRLVFTDFEAGITKTFIFDGYLITLETETKIASPLLLFSVKKDKDVLSQRYQEIFSFDGTGFKKIPLRKTQERVFSKNQFSGARDRYYCASLLKGDYDIKVNIQKNGDEALLYLLNPSKKITLYVGPQIQKNLQPLGLQKIINYGVFHFIAIIILKMLNFIFFITKSWGFSLITLAVIIYFILFPFTAKSTKAMNAMKKIQPEMEKLKEKYKNDPQQMNAAIMKLYKENKVNPLGGCLPLFFQIPVFIALYQILPKFVELKGSSFLWIKDLSLPDNLFTLPFSLPVIGNSINILPIIIMVISIIQQKVMTSVATDSSAKQQKAIGLFFAVFIGVIFYSFPSCLVLYWLIQNLLTLLYQIKTSSKK
ncbi:MAG: YidC/Oxa1 family insertase periplasmic-domain containing protein [Candidatus Omnitrophica bacterium]|nr:YidC/Oxa1 family insertase periplasmic-domain containing protein [Candidatus Omnitrophota bacterium]